MRIFRPFIHVDQCIPLHSLRIFWNDSKVTALSFNISVLFPSIYNYHLGVGSEDSRFNLFSKLLNPSAQYNSPSYTITAVSGVACLPFCVLFWYP